ncbi:MAG: hypothetical protein WCX90_07160 [Thiohalomonadaceae bacterium]
MPTNYDTISKAHYRLRVGTLPLILLGLGLLIFAISLLDAHWRAQTLQAGTGAALVAELGLTDLALFTEARYTRHLSQADRHSAFQDHPLALDHFPSGSLVPPPERLRQP